MQGKSVFLRHDIDLCLEYAEHFARINTEAGIAGTFFLQLRSEMYNLLDFGTREAVERISAMGQYIGLHAVVRSNATPEILAKDMHRDFNLFRSLIPQAQPVFAWHNPSVLQADGFANLEMDFPGLVNAYGSFCGGKHPYYADSNMRWSFEQILEIIRRGEPAFQLAIAPMQWCPEEDDMLGVMASTLLLRLRQADQSWRINHVYKRSLPDGLSESTFQKIRNLLDRNFKGRDDSEQE